MHNLSKDMVRNKIVFEEGLMYGLPRFIFEGRQFSGPEVEDNLRSCADYGIRGGSKIYIVLRLRGGAKVFYSF